MLLDILLNPVRIALAIKKPEDLVNEKHGLFDGLIFFLACIGFFVLIFSFSYYFRDFLQIFSFPFGSFNFFSALSSAGLRILSPLWLYWILGLFMLFFWTFLCHAIARFFGGKGTFNDVFQGFAFIFGSIYATFYLIIELARRFGLIPYRF